MPKDLKQYHQALWHLFMLVHVHCLCLEVSTIKNVELTSEHSVSISHLQLDFMSQLLYFFCKRKHYNP